MPILFYQQNSTALQNSTTLALFKTHVLRRKSVLVLISRALFIWMSQFLAPESCQFNKTDDIYNDTKRINQCSQYWTTSYLQSRHSNQSKEAMCTLATPCLISLLSVRAMDQWKCGFAPVFWRFSMYFVSWMILQIFVWAKISAELVYCTGWCLHWFCTASIFLVFGKQQKSHKSNFSKVWGL